MLLSTGYGRGQVDALVPFMEKHEVDKLLDIRISVVSRNRPEWSGERLDALLGHRRIWLREWGNKARFGEGGIEIADFEGGLERVQGMEGRLLLLCGCGKPEGCHRTYIADDLRLLHRIGVKEIAYPQPQRPEGHTWNFRTGQEELDHLADMEQWALKHPDKMDAKKLNVLEGTRWQYRLSEEFIQSTRAEGWSDEQIIDYHAQTSSYQAGIIRDVLARLKRRGSNAKGKGRVRGGDAGKSGGGRTDVDFGEQWDGGSIDTEDEFAAIG